MEGGKDGGREREKGRKKERVRGRRMEMGRKKNDHLFLSLLTYYLPGRKGRGVPNFSNKTFYFFSQHTFLQIPKMDPIETRQSMFEDPSKGSKATT